MIEFQNVNKFFKTDFWKPPTHILKDLSFKIPEAKVCGFLGANGAGKTTSLKVALQFISYNSGEVKYSSRLGDDWNTIKSNIGFLPEHPYFYPYLTGFEFCSLVGSLVDLNSNSLKEGVSKWAPRVNIEHALQNKIRSYSKGMLQRLGLLTALLHEPKFVILDEPLSGLDPVGRAEIKNIIKTLKKEGKTVFFSSHIVGDVQEVCDHLIVIENGSLLYQGGLKELLEENDSKKYIVKIKGEDDLICSADSLNKELGDLIQRNVEILSVEHEVHNLEQIIYSKGLESVGE